MLRYSTVLGKVCDKRTFLHVMAFSGTTNIADAYNGIKHVEHVQMSVWKKMELLHEVKLILKYWVAMRLGCDESIVREHISTHRIELSEIASIFPHSY